MSMVQIRIEVESGHVTNYDIISVDVMWPYC